MDSLPLELKIAVFEHLRRKGDLLSSALVCRAWRDVAWDKVLWQTHMIRLSGLLESLVGESGSRQIYSNDDFVPLTSDANRFLALAAKATRIHVDVTLVDGVVKVISEVARSAPGKILFPAVHTLNWGEFGDEQGDFAHTVFTGSPIRDIWIDGGYSEEATLASRGLLSSLLAAHPHVQALTVGEDHLPESGGIPEFWKLPSLRSLDYSGFIAFEEWVKCIQECRVLNDVRLVGETRHPVPPNPPPISTPSLRRLDLEDFWDFDLTIAILESIDAPHLMAVDVDAAPDRESVNGEAEHPSAGRARSAFRLLAKRSQRLESLRLRASIELGAEILASFSSLRRLRIWDRTPGCQLDDNGVELLCRSLQNLREFHLSYFPNAEDGEYSKVTPKSFGSFSRNCRYLTYLGLPVTAAKPEDFVGSILMELVAFRENLKHLKFMPLALLADRTNDFVSFLIVQCPKITVLDGYHLEIAGQHVSRFSVGNISEEMTAAFFRAQQAL